MKLQSLSRFLTIRYSIIIGLLVIVFTSLVTVMNDSGIDDTVEYYIFYEAEALTGYYQPYDEVLEFHQGSKEYYWGKEQLPKVYRALFGEHLPTDEMTMFKHERSYVYVLPFALPSVGIEFYVLHIFPFDEYEYSNSAFRTNLQIAAVNLAIILILLMIKFNRQISNQIREFDRWITKASAQDKNNEQLFNKEPIPKSIEFRELNEAAQTLQTSMQSQEQIRQIEIQRVKQEKDFLSSLSHELRTPISVIAAAAALLQKRNELTEKDRDIVKKLVKANKNMGLMTKTLMQVWRKQSRETAAHSVFLADKIKSIASENVELFAQQVDFEFEIILREEQMLDITLVELTLGNLLRNASQYSADGKVTCLVDGNKVTVSNLYDSTQQHEESHYGYGFGLYLVSKICEQESWVLDVTTEHQMFSVSLVFNS